MTKKEAKALQAERIQLFRDAAEFKKTDRIPHFSAAVTWKVFDAGESLPVALTDYDVMEKCVCHFLDKYPVDGILDVGIRNQFRVMEAFGSEGYYFYDDNSVAIHDHAHCTVDTLMEYLDDPTGYAWKYVLPKKFGTDWDNKTLEDFKAAFKEYLKYTMFVIKMGNTSKNKYGIPSTAPNNPMTGSIQFGIEELEANLLGIKDLSLALRRHKNLIKEFCERWDAENIDPFIEKAKNGDGPNMKYAFDGNFIMLSHNIMNNKQFEMFYWPKLKELIEAYESKNMHLRIFAEGSILRYADYFKDFKKGTLTFHIEQDDPFEFRKAFPNCCIMGGLTTDMLSTATPAECVAYTKRLCDELGKDGGLIISENKMLSFRNDCRGYNYKAVCDFLQTYRP